MTRTRRKFTAEEKTAIVRRHLKGKESIATIADELSIQPTQIHQWVAMVIEQAENAFEKTAKSNKQTKLAEAKTTRCQCSHRRSASTQCNQCCFRASIDAIGPRRTSIYCRYAGRSRKVSLGGSHLGANGDWDTEDAWCGLSKINPSAKILKYT